MVDEETRVRGMNGTKKNRGWMLWALIVSLAAGYQLLQHKKASLQGQVVLVTGGSRGLGLAIAQAFAHQGARLAICARDEQELERARQQLAENGAAVLALSGDVTQREQAQQLVQQVTAHYGRIDVLVNNAGVITVGPFQAQTLNDFEESMNVMFWGPVSMILAVLPQMRERREGCIVNISSIGGKVSVPHLLPYSAAKFAFTGLSEGLYTELASEGINVVTVVPGLMRTGSSANALFKGKQHLEYSWFATADSLPLLTISADKAAQKIVLATQRRSAIVILTFPAHVLALAHGLFPQLTMKVLRLTNQFLPKARDSSGLDRRPGRENETAVTRSFLTSLGQRAARTYNQNP